jgi:hypothetical protein
MEEEQINQKRRLIKSGRTAVNELIKIAESIIIKQGSDEDDSGLAADKMKNAAAAKKQAIFDAFEILGKIEEEEENLNEMIENPNGNERESGFAERRAT